MKFLRRFAWARKTSPLTFKRRSEGPEENGNTALPSARKNSRDERKRNEGYEDVDPPLHPKASAALFIPCSEVVVTDLVNEHVQWIASAAALHSDLLSRQSQDETTSVHSSARDMAWGASPVPVREDRRAWAGKHCRKRTRSVLTTEL